ncbi:MAG TPA: hypothetical protein ENL09_02315, partial [Bacteroidetes bacterium]|nr:hypothetical protein [Bacteroidota bacterium]
MIDKNIQIDYDAIKEFVEQALKVKEDEKLKAAIEKLLTKSNETIESLTSLVDVKDQAIQDLEVELSNFKEELEKVNETVEEKEKALEEATNKAEE